LHEVAQEKLRRWPHSTDLRTAWRAPWRGLSICLIQMSLC